MKLKIQILTGETFVVEVKEEATVKDAKVSISRRCEF